MNSPINAIDPDGERVYFIGGANNDKDGWNYIHRWGQAFAKKGIHFYRVNASHGKAGDVAFTNTYRASGRTTYNIPVNNFYTQVSYPVDNKMINATTKALIEHMTAVPLNRAKGEQLNLVGYSYGSVLQAQVALKLADKGYVIDNLVLIGSPISDESGLWKSLIANKNIKNVMRYDIEGDLLSNPQTDKDFILGGIQNRADDGPHFDLARPGAKADGKINEAVTKITSQGVNN